jgi:hypothetical protein
MRILYLDDSGKVHPNDPAKVVVFAGFSVDEESWHDLIRKISGVKARSFPYRGAGNPNEWEIKSTDFIDRNSWRRKKNRRFCFSIPNILRATGCYVYSVSMEKAKATDPLREDKFVPLAFQRLIAKFNAEVSSAETTGSIVCDWSTHQLDRHLTNCITGMVVSRFMYRLRGGITYGSSRALAPLQIADLIAGTLRRSMEGHSELDGLANAFRGLHFTSPGQQDSFGFQVDSVFKLF